MCRRDFMYTLRVVRPIWCSVTQKLCKSFQSEQRKFDVTGTLLSAKINSYFANILRERHAFYGWSFQGKSTLTVAVTGYIEGATLTWNIFTEWENWEITFRVTWFARKLIAPLNVCVAIIWIRFLDLRDLKKTWSAAGVMEDSTSVFACMHRAHSEKRALQKVTIFVEVPIFTFQWINGICVGLISKP